MKLYRKLLGEIYPQKAVKCALLWTAIPRLAPLDDALLNSAAFSA